MTGRVTLQTLPLPMSDADVNAILNSVFYGLTPDGSTLITVRTPSNHVASASLEHCIAKFDVRNQHAELTCYERLIAQTAFDVETAPRE